MGTWLGRITCVNYYRRAIGFKAEMDWVGTYVKTQTYNVEGKITRNISMQICYYKCNRIQHCNLTTHLQVRANRKIDYFYNQII